MTSDTQPPPHFTHWLPVTALGLVALVFLLDLHYPGGLNLPALYVAPVLLTFWQANRRDTVIAAAACTVLTLLRLAWVAGEANWGVDVVNRLLTVLGLWVTALLVVRFKRTGHDAAHLAALVQSSDDAIIGETLDGIITSWNPGATRVFGHSAAEARGRSVTMLVPADRAIEVTNILERIRRGERVDHFETVRVRRDDQRIEVSLSVSPVKDATGRVIGASVIARDVSEERRNEARVRSMLDAAVDSIVVIDTRGVIQLVNPAVERMFGYTAEELLGRNVAALMPSPSREQHDDFLARYLETGERRVIGVGREVEGRRKDGSAVPLALSVSEMKVGGEHTFLGILHDLTELKRSEARLREQSELARLGQMAAVVAHEVRNPLAGIRGALDVIRRRMPADSRDQAVLADVVSRLESLNQFVKDLLVFSRPERAVVSRQPLAPLLQQLIALLKNDPEWVALAVDIDGPDAVLNVDAHLIEQALLNLLVNAAQAMKGTGTIRVRTRSDAGQCHISITDSGPGLAADLIGKIFEPFFTTKHRGTGLGLPVVKRTIEQHGGQIAVHSSPGLGTTVVVSLPLAS
jgi:two-component system sensor kinase FixL